MNFFSTKNVSYKIWSIVDSDNVRWWWLIQVTSCMMFICICSKIHSYHNINLPFQLFFSSMWYILIYLFYLPEENFPTNGTYYMENIFLNNGFSKYKKNCFNLWISLMYEGTLRVLWRVRLWCIEIFFLKILIWGGVQSPLKWICRCWS